MSDIEKQLSVEEARTLHRALDRALMETSGEYRLLKRLEELGDGQRVLWNKIEPLKCKRTDRAVRQTFDEAISDFRATPHDYSDLGGVTRNPDARMGDVDVS